MSGESCYSDLSKYQAELAEERTMLARQRNLPALEWTFSAWIRTGLALTAVALIIPKLIDIGRCTHTLRCALTQTRMLWWSGIKG